jgi:hypothetical protein
MSAFNPILPEFVPVEQTLAAWADARNVIESLIPDDLKFKLTENALELDLDWVEQVTGLVPEDHLKMVVIEAVNTSITLVGPAPAQIKNSFELIGINQDSLDRANLAISALEISNLVAGKPTFIDIFRHCLGLAAFSSSQNQSAALDLSGIKERLNATSAGPWKAVHAGTIVNRRYGAHPNSICSVQYTDRGIVGPDHVEVLGVDGNLHVSSEDLEFMAHAKQDIQELLTEISRLKGEV